MRTGILRARVVGVWVLLAVLAGVIVVSEQTSLFDRAPPPKTGRLPMFAFTEPELGAMEVIYEGRIANVMRDPAGQWFVHDASHSHGGGATDAQPNPGETHAGDPEQAAKIAKQLEITARMLADRRVEPEHDLGEYGLVKPPMMFIFYGRGPDGADYGRPLEVLYVGDMLTSDLAYYAMRQGDRVLSLVPRYYVALLLAAVFGDDQAPSPTPERTSSTDG